MGDPWFPATIFCFCGSSFLVSVFFVFSSHCLIKHCHSWLANYSRTHGTTLLNSFIFIGVREVNTQYLTFCFFISKIACQKGHFIAVAASLKHLEIVPVLTRLVHCSYPGSWLLTSYSKPRILNSIFDSRKPKKCHW